MRARAAAIHGRAPGLCWWRLDRPVNGRQAGPRLTRVSARAHRALTRSMHMADPKKPRPAFAPWDRRELPGAFAVDETARRVGNYKWVEMRLFEALGGW